MITVDKINAEIRDVLARGDNRADVSYLADLYVCRDALMRGEGVDLPLPQKNAPTAILKAGNGTEFERCIDGRCFDDILPILDDLMETIRIINPRLYHGVIRQLQD